MYAYEIPMFQTRKLRRKTWHKDAYIYFGGGRWKNSIPAVCVVVPVNEQGLNDMFSQSDWEAYEEVK